MKRERGIDDGANPEKKIPRLSKTAAEEFENEFEDDDDLSSMCEEVEASQSSASNSTTFIPQDSSFSSSSSSSLKWLWNGEAGHCERFVVLSFDKTKLSACMKSTESGNILSVFLQDDWEAIELSCDDPVVLWTKDEEPISSPLVLNSKTSSLLFVFPQLMINGTSITGGIDCVRRSVICDRFRVTSPSNCAILVGNLFHSLFEDGILEGKFTSSSGLKESISQLIEQRQLSLISAGISSETLMSAVEKLLPVVRRFVAAFVLPAFPKTEIACNGGGYHKRNPQRLKLKISGVTSSEELMQIPNMGIQGKLDASVLVEFVSSPNSTTEKVVVPFELKTGKDSSSGSHRAQVSLYTVLLSRVLSKAVPFGLLCHLGIANESMKAIEPVSDELCSLFVIRNELAVSIMSGRLPPPLPAGRGRSCLWCEYRDICIGNQCLSRKEREREGEKLQEEKFAIDEWMSPIESMFTDRRMEYLRKWLNIVDLEESEDLCRIQNQNSDLEELPPTRPTANFNSSLARGNLFSLALAAPRTSMSRIRQLIFDLSPPSFASLPLMEFPTLPTFHLNADQKNMIAHLSRARDYCIVFGMPGTGKSATLAVAVHLLASIARKRVLVCAYTHAAVNAVIEKVVKLGTPVVRFGLKKKGGTKRSVNSLLEDYSPEEISRMFRGSRETEEGLVVGATALGAVSSDLLAAHPTQPFFDYLIFDEASQCTQPTNIGPLTLAKTFCLVGDPYQLPPLVLSERARAAGGEESLFVRLSEAHPDSVISLRQQYRMNDGVVSICNALVYGGALVCANSRIAHRRLELKNFLEMKSSIASLSIDWILKSIDPVNSVLWIDTCDVVVSNSNASRMEKKIESGGYENAFESKVLKILVDVFVQCGLNEDSLGVMSPYVRQLHRIRDDISVTPISSSIASQAIVSVNTIDTFQGSDKPAMLVSLVRSNEHNDTGPLLLDKNRINVAVTRAQTKLILIGDSATLKRSPVMAKVFETVHESGIVLPLSEGDAKAIEAW